MARRSIAAASTALLAAAPDFGAFLPEGAPAFVTAAPLAATGGLPATALAGTTTLGAAAFAAGALLAAPCAFAATRTRACTALAAALFSAGAARLAPSPWAAGRRFGLLRRRH